MKTMHPPAHRLIFAITACALGAAAVASASAQEAAPYPQAATTAPALQPTTADAAPAPQLATAHAPLEENAEVWPHARILGAVNVQGNLYRQRDLLPGENAELIGTLADCLAQADGWLQNADLARVHILRAADAGTNVPPTIVDFRQYLQRGNSAYNPAIYVNDTLYIPTTGSTGTESVQTIRQIEERYYSTYYYPQRPTVYIIQPAPPKRPHRPGHPNSPPPPPPPRPRPQPQPQPPVQEGIRVVPVNSRQQQQTRPQTVQPSSAPSRIHVVPSGSQPQPAQPRLRQEQQPNATPARGFQQTNR